MPRHNPSLVGAKLSHQSARTPRSQASKPTPRQAKHPATEPSNRRARRNKFVTFYRGDLVGRLRELEREGLLDEGKSILVIPAANALSMNIHKRFWPVDNTDVNRMFLVTTRARPHNG